MIDKKATVGIALVMALLFTIFTLRMHLVEPPAVDNQHQFQTERALSRLSRILGDQAPHPVDSVANDSVRSRLLSEIRSLGFTPIVRDNFHCSEGRESMRCARVRNVMFWVGEQGPNAVMVASHYDSVPAGPGAGDDGAGVAASLEIAALLKGKNLPRPVLVLITDGEEIGLVGAASFVDKDPFAKLVSAVVSMEARGVSGPVAMFQTSTPNGRDISALKSDIKTASTNSLAADVYERMPNGTDVTEYLALDVDVGNFAIGGSPEFYHTPRDNLAMLDKRSFFHMGVSALNSVKAFTEQSGDEPEQQWIYTDVFGFAVLAIPAMFSMPLIILAGLGALVVALRNGYGSMIRSFAYPFVAIIVGVGLAILVTLAVAALRPEAHYAAAHPWALRVLQNSAALLGALISLMWLGRAVSPERLLMSSWVCLAFLGGLLSFFFSGAAILFVPALVLLIVACVFHLIENHGVAKALTVGAGLVFLATVIPTSALGEMMLFLEYAAPFTVFLVFCFILLVPHVLSNNGFGKKIPRKIATVNVCIVVLAMLATIFVPAYNEDAPRGLSIIQFNEADSESAKFGAFTKAPLPRAMNDVVEFSPGQIPSFDNKAYVAGAPMFETLGIDVQIEQNELIGDDRRVTISIEAPDSNIVVARIEQDDTIVTSMSLNGINKTENETKGVFCHGRACRSLQLAFTVNAGESPLSLRINGFRYGLAPEAQELLLARPASVLPRGWGDVRLVSTKVPLN